MENFRIDNVVQDYHGTKIADPFRYLEDSEDSDTKEFIQSQNEKTRKFLDSTKGIDAYKKRIKELWDFEKFSTPKKWGDYYYYQYNDGLSNQPVFMRVNELSNNPLAGEIVLDPNQIDSSGQTALASYSVSPNGQYFVYGLSTSGSDWQAIKVKDLDSKEDLPDEIKWCKFTTLPWLPDSSGFLYSRYPNPETVSEEDSSRYNKVYMHKLNTKQSEDALIKEDDNPDKNFSPKISDDGKYIILNVSQGSSSASHIYYKELDSEQDFQPLITTEDTISEYLGNDSNVFYFLTNDEAPRKRIISIDINSPDKENWITIVPEGMDVITHAKMTDSTLALAFMHNAYHQLMLYSLSGQFIKRIELPTLGAITELNEDKENNTFFFDFASFLYPNSIFKCDVAKGVAKILFTPEIEFDFEEYKTYQVFYKSKDNTEIPMFISHHKDVKLNGNNKTYLYSYGGFNVARIPEFKASDLAWLENGNIFAVANLRGGSEFGEQWHKAGMLENKQNVFDDFIAAAEYLIEEDYTNPSKLAIKGRSNGGLLTAACMLQRPDLYGAVVSQVPVIDMFRYHKFTVGRFWVPEYGNAEENIDHFKFLYEYSPLHNIRFGTVYPPILITTAKTDDRVVPMHSFKFAASLQTVNLGNNPILLRVEFGAGHGGGKPTNLLISEEADIYAFVDTMLSKDEE
ncbi:MAG: prolyl oligopeptidase family serine peptidase [Clostridia bacterium]